MKRRALLVFSLQFLVCRKATPPAFQATSIYALRFGCQPALPYGQYLLDQKGPIRGGFRAATCKLRPAGAPQDALRDFIFLFQAVQEVHVALGEVRAFFRFHFVDGGVDLIFDVVREAAVG